MWGGVVGGGGFHSIMWSPQLCFVLELGCDNYQKALTKLDLANLNDRSDILCRNFAIKSTKNQRTKKMFPLNKKTHNMESRKPEKFKVLHANTSRFQNSSIIYMQKLLNENEF